MSKSRDGKVAPGALRKFQQIVWRHYRVHGRRFPWRRTQNPYRILVSEVMLQQTQTERVVPFYAKFLKTFPTVAALAQASLREVLRVWQGLGYNRRALMLHRAATMMARTYGGRVPKSEAELRTLSGIGPYTASAVLAFAYNKPTVFIETNIRTVFLHHFFSRRRKVGDRAIVQFVAATADQKNPREWYYALMDYGAFLKKQHGNANRRSAHYTRQTKFEGSDRQIRGAIIRLLAGSRGMATQTLAARVGGETERVQRIAQQLTTEGFVVQRKGKYRIV